LAVHAKRFVQINGIDNQRLTKKTRKSVKMGQQSTREPTTADESPKAASNDTSAGEWPDFANSSRFHSAPFQRRPVNRSTGPRFHSTPFHRLKSPKTGCPGAVSAKAFAKAHQPAGRASGPCQNFRPHSAPKISPTSGAPGKPLA